MKLVMCMDGHFYDGDKYVECPHCKLGKKGFRNNYSIVERKREIISCDHGHEYDAAIYEECPICRVINPNNERVFEKLTYRHGSYYSEYTEWEISEHDGLLDVRYSRHNGSEIKEFHDISCEKWMEAISELDIYEWDSQYLMNDLHDGPEWVVEYKEKHKKQKHVYIYGGIVNPDTWRGFLDLIKELEEIIESQQIEKKEKAGAPKKKVAYKHQSMNIVVCGRGHFYNADKYDSCPGCAKNQSESDQSEKDNTTIPDIADSNTENEELKKQPETKWSYCVNCGKKLNDQSMICSACRVDNQAFPNVRCHNCGEYYHMLARFCPYCGEKSDQKNYS